MNMKFFWMTAGLLAAATALAVETKTWTQSEAAEFEKGTLKGLAVSSEGRLSLSPAWKEKFDAGAPHLWCAVQDGKGNLYAAGAEGKVFTVDAKGKGRLLTTLDGGVVYALAAGPKGDLFAAVSPEAKVYRIDAAGKAALHSTLKAGYVWSLLPGPDGSLYAATGAPGQIQRIGQDGRAQIVLDAEETHVRSLAWDGKGNLIAGTEPGGVVLRVSPKGEGFVLYQTAKREVTALVVAADGTIYAAASGNRGTAPATGVSAPAVPVPVPAAQPPGVQIQAGATRVSVPPPSTVGIAPATAGGGEIYSIAPDGEPRRMWSNAQVTVYALALDKDGKLVAGTGNQGRIYRIDNGFSSTRLIDAEPQQVTAFAAGPGGALMSVTANPGKVFQMGPGTETTGTLESDLLDAGAFTYWGRLRYEGEANGGAITLETRSGNLDHAQKDWSAWTPVDGGRGSRIGAPPARFLGWRATLTAGPDGKSPLLKLVEAAYQAKNAAPVLERLEITPANHKFPTASSSLTASSTLSLPPFGQPKRSTPPAASSGDTGAATMNYDKGWLGARWRATDANGDTLEAKVEIRGAQEREWKPLKEKVKESRCSWDASGFADGRYRLRVTVTDEEDNYPGQGLSASAESDEFVIDNTPPQMEDPTARIEGAKIAIRFKAKDELTALQYAEFSVNGGPWISAQPTTRMTDSLEHEYAVETAKPAGSEFTVAVKVADENDNVTVRKVTVH
jgi:hypothetical protein